MVTPLVFAGLALLKLATSPVNAQAGVAVSAMGCYSDHSSSDFLGSKYQYQTYGYCQFNCTAYNYMYINEYNCYCTNNEPTHSATNCNIPCPGYGEDTCGGTDSYNYWLNELYTASSSSTSSSTVSSSATSSSSASKTNSASSTNTATDSSASTSSDTSTISQSTVTGMETVTMTSSVSSPAETAATSKSTSKSTETGTPSDDSKKSSDNGISSGAIAGIVVGAIGAIAILAALFLFWRRRNNSQNAYVASKSPLGFTDPFGSRVEDKMAFGGLNGGPANSSFMAVDQRLNPVMLGERRLSEGSIADERDYSRKILRVANPDDNA